MKSRQLFDALSKALVTVAVMLSILIMVKGPVEESSARAITALLLALGTFGLVALNLAGPSSKSPSRR